MVVGDVTDEGDCAAIVEAAGEPLHGVVLNVGIGRGARHGRDDRARTGT